MLEIVGHTKNKNRRAPGNCRLFRYGGRDRGGCGVIVIWERTGKDGEAPQCLTAVLDAIELASTSLVTASGGSVDRTWGRQGSLNVGGQVASRSQVWNVAVKKSVQ